MLREHKVDTKSALGKCQRMCSGTKRAPSRFVAWAHGGGMWWRHTVEVNGNDMRQWHVVVVCGKGTWWRPAHGDNDGGDTRMRCQR